MHTSIRPIIFGFIATAARQSPSKQKARRNRTHPQLRGPVEDTPQPRSRAARSLIPAEVIFEPEIDSRVRQALKELGYFRPQTSDISFTPKAGSEIVDVTI